MIYFCLSSFLLLISSTLLHLQLGHVTAYSIFQPLKCRQRFQSTTTFASPNILVPGCDKDDNRCFISTSGQDEHHKGKNTDIKKQKQHRGFSGDSRILSIEPEISNSRRKVLKKVCSTIFLVSVMHMDSNSNSNNKDNNGVFSYLHPPEANAEIYDNGPNVQTPIIKLPSGVSYQDLRLASSDNDGYGDKQAKIGDRVNIQWVLKRSNGYYIDASSNDDGLPFIFTVGSSNSNNANNRPILGLDEGIQGMRVGGIRRIVLPLKLSYVEGVEDGKPGPVPKGFGPKQRVRRVMEFLKDDIPGESFILDVKLTRIQ